MKNNFQLGEFVKPTVKQRLIDKSSMKSMNQRKQPFVSQQQALPLERFCPTINSVSTEKDFQENLKLEEKAKDSAIQKETFSLKCFSFRKTGQLLLKEPFNQLNQPLKQPSNRGKDHVSNGLNHSNVAIKSCGSLERSENDLKPVDNFEKSKDLKKMNNGMLFLIFLSFSICFSSILSRLQQLFLTGQGKVQRELNQSLRMNQVLKTLWKSCFNFLVSLQFQQIFHPRGMNLGRNRIWKSFESGRNQIFKSFESCWKSSCSFFQPRLFIQSLTFMKKLIRSLTFMKKLKETEPYLINNVKNLIMKTTETFDFVGPKVSESDLINIEMKKRKSRKVTKGEINKRRGKVLDIKNEKKSKKVKGKGYMEMERIIEKEFMNSCVHVFRTIPVCA